MRGGFTKKINKTFNYKKSSILNENNNPLKRTNKTENDSIVDNISIITSEIDFLENNINTDKCKNVKDTTSQSYLKTTEEEICIIIKFLKEHIQALTTARAKLLYNKNNKELENNKKKSSIFKIFKKKTKHTENTLIQTKNKQTFNILLLENKFITKIIKKINNTNFKIEIFLEFFNKNHDYTLEYFNKYIQDILNKYKNTSRDTKSANTTMNTHTTMNKKINNDNDIQINSNSNTQKGFNSILRRLMTLLSDKIKISIAFNLFSLFPYAKGKKNLINEAVIHKIFSALLTNTTQFMININLSQSLNKQNFTIRNLKLFEKYLKSTMTKLLDLNMSSCDLNPTYFSTITNAILENTNLKIYIFILDNNNIGKTDYLYNKRLHNGNTIADTLHEDLTKAAMSLRALLNNNIIKTLSLSNCSINNLFFDKIKDALSNNTSLLIVNLSNNKINEEQILELAKLFLNNKTSQMKINLIDNLVTPYFNNTKKQFIKINNIKLFVNDSLIPKIQDIIDMNSVSQKPTVYNNTTGQTTRTTDYITEPVNNNTSTIEPSKTIIPIYQEYKKQTTSNYTPKPRYIPKERVPYEQQVFMNSFLGIY